MPPGTAREGSVVVAVAVDGVAAGVLVLADEIRPEAAAVLAAFRQRGVERIVLASGDHADVTDAVGARARCRRDQERADAASRRSRRCSPSASTASS